MKIQIILFEGCDELDVVGPYEVLQMAAKAGANFSIELVTLGGASEICGAHGFTMKTTAAFVTEDNGLLLVPGGGYVNRAAQGVWAEIKNRQIPEAIARAHLSGMVVASVCSGALLLAAAGLTQGRPCTTHHQAKPDLAASGARVLDQRVVDDGDLITSGGVTSGIDLGLHLVKRLAGEDLAETIRVMLEYF